MANDKEITNETSEIIQIKINDILKNGIKSNDDKEMVIDCFNVCASLYVDYIRKHVTDKMLDEYAKKVDNYLFYEMTEFVKENFLMELVLGFVNDSIGFSGYETLGDMYYHYLNEHDDISDDTDIADGFIDIIKHIRREYRETHLSSLTSFIRNNISETKIESVNIPFKKNN